MNTQQHTPNPRVPLFIPSSQRGEDVGLDAKIVNGYVEKLPDGNLILVKRPGYVLSGLGTGAIGVPRGCFSWNNQNKFVSVVNGNLYDGATLIGAVSNAADSFYTFDEIPVPGSELSTNVILQNGSGNPFYKYNGTGLITSINTGIGGSLAPGSAYLDGTLYFMNYRGFIYGSAINDITTWPGANVIAAQMRPGLGIYIFRQLNYVVILKQLHGEAFFDAGNATGSPLQSAPNTFFPYGCADGATFQQIEDTAIWVSSGTSMPMVVTLTNMVPKIVSTPAVEKLLRAATYPNVGTPTSSVNRSWAFRLYGHRFYGLCLGTSHTLVYDIDGGEWYVWTDWQGPVMPISFCSTHNNLVMMQGGDGRTYSISGQEYTDNGNPILVEVVTPNWDGGTRAKKFCPRMDIEADQATSGLLSIRNSDDDYQTWSNFRQVDLSKGRPALYSCGTFRKRAWHLKYDAPTALRLRALQLSLLVGSV